MSDTAPVPIQQRLMQYVREEIQPGEGHYTVSKLVGDASARQYYRVVVEGDQGFVIAVYPEPFDLAEFTYLQVYKILTAIGLPVPKILAIDAGRGIVMQEDLGNESLQNRLIQAGTEETRRWLCGAIDYLIRIQQAGTLLCRSDTAAGRLAFDVEKLSWELEFFFNHYLKRYRERQIPGAEEAALRRDFAEIAEEMAAAPRYLCHRDYHCRNLMIRGDKLFILDFQDARMGPCTYDLASLLRDSIDLGPEMSHDLINYFVTRNRAVVDSNRQDFMRLFNLTTIQRLLKALGTFGYQITTRQNFIYEQYVRGSLLRTSQALREVQRFPAITRLIDSEI